MSYVDKDREIPQKKSVFTREKMFTHAPSSHFVFTSPKKSI